MTSANPQSGTIVVGRLETDEQSAHRIAALCAETFDAHDIAVSIVDSGRGAWQVAMHFHAMPDDDRLRALIAAAAGAIAAAAVRFEILPARDWVRESLEGLGPVHAGRFVVHGAHDRSAVPVNRIGIEIEAAAAFGTGHHGTTHGCLLALDRICKAHKKTRTRILDLGTGSGVLAIAAARALRRCVLATDIDISAARAARLNARHNHAGALVQIITADGVTAQAVRAAAPFDLIFANILLGPLQRLAAPLKQLTATGGLVVLSGLLTSQANAALAAYRPLTLVRRIEIDGWATLVLRRGGTKHRTLRPTPHL